MRAKNIHEQKFLISRTQACPNFPLPREMVNSGDQAMTRKAWIENEVNTTVCQGVSHLSTSTLWIAGSLGQQLYTPYLHVQTYTWLFFLVYC